MKKVNRIWTSIKKILNAPFETDDDADTYQARDILQAPFFLVIGAVGYYLCVKFIHNDLISRLIIAAVIWYCGVCIVVSIDHVFDIADNRKKKSQKVSDAKKVKSRKYAFDKFVRMMEENDILDVVILCNGHTVSVRASSDYTAEAGQFFDKCYYVGKTEYQTLDELADALSQLLGTQADVEVLSIDGLAPKYFK